MSIGIRGPLPSPTAQQYGLTAPSIDQLADPQWQWVQRELDRLLGQLRQSQSLNQAIANQMIQNRDRDIYNQRWLDDMNLRVTGQQHGFQNETFGRENQLAGLRQSNQRYLQGLEQSLAATQYNRAMSERPSAFEQSKRLLGY